MNNDSETRALPTSEVGGQPQNGAANTNQTPPESRGEVLGNQAVDPDTLAALRRVNSRLENWSGIGSIPDEERGW